MNKLNEMSMNFGVKAGMFLSNCGEKIKNKLVETNGADGTTEKGGWIIAVFIIIASVIGLIYKITPEFGDMVMNKFKEFFSFATVS